MRYLNINTIKYVLRSSYERSLGFLSSRDWIIAVILYWIFMSLFSLRGFKKKAFYFATLISYVFLMYMFTVFERTDRGIYTIRLRPFWSYIEVYNGNSPYILQIAFNVLMFVPIGILLRLIEVRFSLAIIYSALLSYSVEVMQLVFRRGYFELFDDPFHNLLGAIIAYGLTSIMVILCKRITEYCDGR